MKEIIKDILIHWAKSIGVFLLYALAIVIMLIFLSGNFGHYWETWYK